MREAIRSAVGSAALEGIHPTPLTTDLLELVALGELTEDEAVEMILNHYRTT